MPIGIPGCPDFAFWAQVLANCYTYVYEGCFQCGTGLAFPTLNQASFRPADLAPEVRESQPEDPRANLAWGRRWS